jgi:hypothetical protein
MAALRSSQQRLAAAAQLSDHQLAGQSYDDDRSLAQVLSHLGSGGKIFGMHHTTAGSARASPVVKS